MASSGQIKLRHAGSSIFNLALYVFPFSLLCWFLKHKDQLYPIMGSASPRRANLWIIRSQNYKRNDNSLGSGFVLPKLLWPKKENGHNGNCYWSILQILASHWSISFIGFVGELIIMVRSTSVSNCLGNWCTAFMVDNWCTRADVTGANVKLFSLTSHEFLI